MVEEQFDSFDELEAHFQKDDAFDPEEMVSINRVLSVTGISMPERMMEARNLKPDSDEFKAQFPNGIACLDIALEGIDVEYDFGEGNIRHVVVELVNFQGKNIGKYKTEGSKLHITSQAFEDVLGTSIFGKDNRDNLAGRVARWGQHMDKAEIDGKTVSWAWDIPREALENDFTYSGEVRKIQGRAQKEASGTASASAGTAEMSDDDAKRAILEVIVGQKMDSGDELTPLVMAIEGLPNEFAQICLQDTLLQSIFELGLVDAEADIIVATDAGRALIASAVAA
jgi:hypothetical protein